ncbi:iron-sulfur cluster co-chaperone protein HscB [Sphaerodactylus townsendi]|uniref:iron-sulfur cluster co-chaperone protein HscB n=1 Tax=Sphaerodactylus townsendi TaxID=933632 RepID=UPI002025D37E|nr:iron-sulfur cluster co-chaperone protein HscB [Sphaerodactylus townsendi]
MWRWRPRTAAPTASACSDGGWGGVAGGGGGLPSPSPSGPVTPPALLPPLPRSPRTFRLDQAELQRRFRSLQRRLHPDGFGQSSQAEREFSEQHSALVNEAYDTLRRPLSRGLYLLQLRGVELQTGADSEADPEFLSEIMEINEKLAATDQEDARAELEVHIAAKQEELAKDVAQAFDQDDLQKAKRVLAKMKYFANLEEKVKSKKIPS